MRTGLLEAGLEQIQHVGMKPLSERDENLVSLAAASAIAFTVGMKPLSERDENWSFLRLHWRPG